MLKICLKTNNERRFFINIIKIKSFSTYMFHLKILGDFFSKAKNKLNLLGIFIQLLSVI